MLLRYAIAQKVITNFVIFAKYQYPLLFQASFIKVISFTWLYLIFILYYELGYNLAFCDLLVKQEGYPINNSVLTGRENNGCTEKLHFPYV